MAVRHKNTNNGTKINGGNTVRRTVTKPIIKDEPIENPYDFEEEIIEDEIDLEDNFEDEIIEDDFEDEIIDDEEITEEEIIEETPKKVTKSSKTSAPIGKKKTASVKVKPLNNIPKEATAKKKLGGSKPKKEKSNTIGNVYPIEKLVENIQNALDERFEGITKKDSEIILRIVENEIYKAASQSTVRLFGGRIKAKEKAASITSPNKTKKDYYKTSRWELVLESCIISDYENYAGTKDEKNGVFIVDSIRNKKTGEYEPVEPFELPLKENK